MSCQVAIASDPVLPGEPELEPAKVAAQTDSVPEGEPETFVFIVGVEDIYNHPDIPTAPGAVADCHMLEAFFEEEVGFPPSNVVGMCGSEATRTRTYSLLQATISEREDVDAGDVVIWIMLTPGWHAPANEHLPQELPLYLMYDAFESNSNNGTPNGTWQPGIMPVMIKRVYGPLDMTTVMLTDSIHEGTYLGRPMRGPIASDEISESGEGSVMALSATGGDPSPSGVFARNIMACWSQFSDTDGDGWVHADQFAACVTGGMSQHNATANVAGEWTSERLGYYSQGELRRAQRRAARVATKPGLRYITLGAGAVSLVGALAVHSQAVPLYNRLAQDPTGYNNAQEWTFAQDQYKTLYWTRTGLYALSAASLSVGTGTLLVGPNRVTLSGTF